MRLVELADTQVASQAQHVVQMVGALLGRGRSDASTSAIASASSSSRSSSCRAARAAAHDRAKAPAHAVPRAASPPRTCTRRSRRRAATRRMATPAPSRRRRGGLRASGCPSAASSAPPYRSRPPGIRATSPHDREARVLPATFSSPCAFSRCCQSGVRCPGRRRGIRSQRAAFSRQRAPNNAVSRAERAPGPRPLPE